MHFPSSPATQQNLNCCVTNKDPASQDLCRTTYFVSLWPCLQHHVQSGVLIKYVHYAHVGSALIRTFNPRTPTLKAHLGLQMRAASQLSSSFSNAYLDGSMPAQTPTTSCSRGREVGEKSGNAPTVARRHEIIVLIDP